MQYTKQGLELTRDEIVALLAFACSEPERSNFYGVHFQTKEDRIRARATDGKIAIDVFGVNSSKKQNEWFVYRDFLRRPMLLLDKSHRLVIRFKGKSVHEAAIYDKDGKELSVYQWPSDAVNHQVTFPDAKIWDLRFVRLDSEYLKVMGKVATAAGVAGVDCYGQAREGQNAVFRCEGTDTVWHAAIAPMVSDEDDADEAHRVFRELSDSFQPLEKPAAPPEPPKQQPMYSEPENAPAAETEPEKKAKRSGKSKATKKATKKKGTGKTASKRNRKAPPA